MEQQASHMAIRSIRNAILFGLAFGYFAAFALSGVVWSVVPNPLSFYVVYAVVFVCSVVAALCVQRDGKESNKDDVWDAIPDWQYSGRHAESGGISRSEQERAIRDIERQASEREQR